MRRHHQHQNIPTEIIRTIVAIAEMGSFSKAGAKLGLSQPTISAQVKRLQIMVGGTVFDKVAGGVVFTPLGELVLSHARRLLAENDQILSLGGTVDDVPVVRIGSSSFFVDQLLALWNGGGFSVPVVFTCDNSADLAKGLLDGYLDIACLLCPDHHMSELAVHWLEEFVWVRSRDFVLSPGSPIPLVGWPGGFADTPAVRALERAGMSYRVVFSCSEHHARQTAVAAGIGIMALPRRQFSAPLVLANEYYLPQLQPMRAGISLRPGFNNRASDQIIAVLSQLAPHERQTATV